MKIKVFKKIIAVFILSLFIPMQVFAFDQPGQIAAVSQAPTVDANTVSTPSVTPQAPSSNQNSITFIQGENSSLQEVEANERVAQIEQPEEQTVKSEPFLSELKSAAVLAALDSVKAEENQVVQTDTDISKNTFVASLQGIEFPAETQRRLLVGEPPSPLPTLQQAQQAMNGIPEAIRPYTTIQYKYPIEVLRKEVFLTDGILTGEAKNQMVDKPTLQQAIDALNSVPEAIRPYVKIRFRETQLGMVVTGTISYGPDGIGMEISSMTPLPSPPPPPPLPSLRQQLADLWNKISQAMEDGSIENPYAFLQLFYEGLEQIYQERYNAAQRTLQSGQTDIEKEFIKVMRPISEIPYIENIGDAGHNCAFFAACTTAVGQKNDFYVYNVGIWFYSYEKMAPDISGPPQYRDISHAINLVWLGRSDDGLFDYYGFWEPQEGRMLHRFVVDASDKDPKKLPPEAILGYMKNSGYGFPDGQYRLSLGISIRSEAAMYHPRNQAAIKPSLLKFLYQAYLPPDLAEQAIDSIPDISKYPAER